MSAPSQESPESPIKEENTIEITGVKNRKDAYRD
jgi:hypothetical protein